MNGNFTSGRRPSLKKRLESLRRQNAAIGKSDRANRCGTCLAPVPSPAFVVFGSATKYCSALCVPAETTAEPS